ncbi:diguanylate cyclase domain-containing protein [Inhella sp.]|uniref:diguanylate cyclase domain-containing protein n=1 Tax=Inhella sp. TaxID=1921806 RepID=UPI0035B24E42
MTADPRLGRGSLVQRLTRLNVGVLALTLFLSFVLVQGMAYYTARAQQREAAGAAATLLAQNLAPMLAFQDPRAAQIQLDEVAGRRADLRELQLLDVQGRSFAHWRSRAPVATLARLPGFGQAFELRVPIVLQNDPIGALHWREAQAELEAMMARIWLGGLALLLLALLLAALALRWVQRRALAPLVALAELTERVATTQDYGLRAAVVHGDEVGRLAGQVNEMLRRIQVWHQDLHQQLQQQRQAGMALRQLAHRDHLTGLPNRLSFDIELERQVIEVQHGQQALGLLFIDLDHFKAINDQLGHAAGDEVLIEATQRLSSVLRDQDTLFRLGGDEFALLVAPLHSAATLEQLAGRLIAAVSAPLQVRGRAMPLGASIGGAIAPQHGQEAAALLRQADTAMYAAKAAGKNCYRIATP